MSKFSTDLTFSQLLADPAAAAVIEDVMPAIPQHPMFAMFKNMTPKAVQALSGGKITPDTLSMLQEKLAALG